MGETVERRIVQLPLDRGDLTMLTYFAVIGASAVEAARAMDRSEANRVTQSLGVARKNIREAVNLFDTNPELFSWDRWTALNRLSARLALVAFPDMEIEWSGDRRPGEVRPGESPADPQGDGAPR